MTVGIVSALGRRLDTDTYNDFYIQIDAPINKGNSGGPTFASMAMSSGSIRRSFPRQVARSVSGLLFQLRP